MSYTQWLTTNFPHLKSESSVKIFNYVKKAKDETKKQRALLFLVCLIFSVLTGYSIGYVFAKYTDTNFWIIITFIILIVVFVSNKIEKLVEQYILRKKLTQLVKSSS